MNTANSTAVVYTIKNEARSLPDAIRWHRALGVQRFYVFLDRTTDEMRAWLPTQPDVVVSDSVRPVDVDNPPRWISDLGPAWQGFIDARKNVNSWIAARAAAEDGITWLAMIDPDELVLPDRSAPPSPEGFRRLIRSIPAHTDQLLFRNCDVVPEHRASSFFDHRLFVERQPMLERLWKPFRKALITLPIPPKTVAGIDHRFWNIALRGNLPWRLIDPETGKPIPTGYFLSYASHKSLFRTERHDEYQPVIHHWIHRYGRRRSVVDPSARVLHFDLPDVDQFIHKFSQRRGQREFSPRHFYVRRRLTEIAAGESSHAARQYFDDYIVLDDQTRIADLVRNGVLIDLPHVASFFEISGGHRS